MVFEEAIAVSDGVLALAHDPGYIDRVSQGKLSDDEIRLIGFPWSLAMVERSRRSVGATVQACRQAIQDGVSANLAGGTHHAFRDRGEGFCVFNDAAIAARLMQTEWIQRVGQSNRQSSCNATFNVAIIDLDVHQGNGTAAIFKNDESVFTLSIHGERNYPFEKEFSDIDIGLPDETGDAIYLDVLEQRLAQLFERFHPHLVIYLAGADPSEKDRLGRLKLTKEGLKKRDLMVLAQMKARQIPMAICMAGGYARLIEDTVDIHFQTLQLAHQFFESA